MAFNSTTDQLLECMCKEVGAKGYLVMFNPSQLNHLITLDFGDGWLCQVRLDHRDLLQFSYSSVSPAYFAGALDSIHKKMCDARDEMFLLGERTVD